MWCGGRCGEMVDASGAAAVVEEWSWNLVVAMNGEPEAVTTLATVRSPCLEALSPQDFSATSFPPNTTISAPFFSSPPHDSTTALTSNFRDFPSFYPPPALVLVSRSDGVIVTMEAALPKIRAG
ncbi:hypothetical protein Drorol1_Dr00026766 [Drosera rotundifolia]